MSVPTYEPYTQAEILLDVTLEELHRFVHRQHGQSMGQALVDPKREKFLQTCDAFPCRMIQSRRDEAWELIRKRQKDEGWEHGSMGQQDGLG